MKKIITVLIFLYVAIYGFQIRATAEEYVKTIDYRHKFIARYDGAWYNSPYTEWDIDNDFTFTDTNTIQTTMSSPYTTNNITVTVTNSNDSGEYFITGALNAGYPTPSIYEEDVDYIYKYPTSTVDTDYTVSFTFDTDITDYLYVDVSIRGVSRLDDTQSSAIETYRYRATPNTGEYSYGDTCTYTGDDGYNYAGFIIRVVAITSNANISMNGTTYKLWTITSSLDTVTPDIDYGQELENINGTLSSIYTSITSGFTSITNAIANLPNTIIMGIKNLFIYDDWQEDIESINETITIPYVSDIVTSLSGAVTAFATYSPISSETLTLPNLITDSPANLITYNLDLVSILGSDAIGGMTWLQLIRLATSFATLGFYYAMIRRILLKVGIDIDDVISPIIRKVGNL